jgi:hypothetical protein
MTLAHLPPIGTAITYLLQITAPAGCQHDPVQSIFLDLFGYFFGPGFSTGLIDLMYKGYFR